MAKVKISFISWRYHLLVTLICLAVAGLAFRIFNLTVLNQSFLRKEGDERTLRLVNSTAFRGMILDRNGSPLAVSTIAYSAWINPQEFAPDNTSLQSLANLLGMQANEILHIRQQKKQREFAYLKRALAPEVAKQIKELGLNGLYLQQEYRRYYPEGEVTAHVVGFTNIDDNGQEGLELGYNQWLRGEPGKKWVLKDRLGREIADVQTVQEQKPGHDLVLSIDKRIQYLAYRALLAGVQQNQAHSGSAVVLDAKTGEILAMVNQPSYNPNNRAGKTLDTFRNRAITDTFEPGSTIKAFTVASALENNKVQPDTVIDTSPGWMRVGRNMVRDERNNGPLSIAQILQYSSNMGAAKMVLQMPPDSLWDLLHRVGFGENTGVGYPGEQSGSLIKHDPWGAFTLATLSFGYGLSVTPLQLTRAYSVLADEGMKLPISLVRLDAPPQGERVLDAQVAHKMLRLLESVVAKKGGTAEAARVPGYRIAGKTGTAKKVGVEGYQKHRYNSSFVGIAPVSNPRLIVAVVVNDPQGKNYYGGTVSAPIFAKIMEGSLRILDIPPDAN